MATTQQFLVPEHDVNQDRSGLGVMEDPVSDQKHEDSPEVPESGSQTSEATHEPSIQGKASSEEDVSSIEHLITASQVQKHMNYTSSHLMDYISKLESRIERLETGKRGGRAESAKAHTDGSQSQTIEGIPLPQESEGKGRTSTQFFYEDYEPSNAGWNIPGTFLSEVDDANPLIRVLYKWIGPKPEHVPQAPSPEDIEILELRITSKPVTEFLENRLEFDFSENCVLHLTKPFRLLIRHFSTIEEECSRLVEQSKVNKPDHASDHEETHEATDSNESPKLDSQGLDVTPSRTDLAYDFQILVDFAQRYLATSLGLFKNYANDFLTTITFDNLWMLFNMGDNMYCPSKKGGQEIRFDLGLPPYVTVAGPRPQIYRVAASIEGLPDDKSLVPDSKTAKTATVSSSSDIRSNYTPLYVFCYYLDLKNKKISINKDVFKFSPFDGEVEITSLEAYPLQYQKHAGVESEDLMARGRKFVDLMLVRHRRYDGYTASENMKEINSDVIVDYEICPRILPKSPLDSMAGFWGVWERYGTIEVRKRICKHAKCASGACWVDYYMNYAGAKSDKLYSSLVARLDAYDLIRTEQDMVKCRKFLEKEDLLCLLGGVVNGYSLRNREWVRLDINLLRPVSYEDGWNELVLPEGHRKMVQAMVETFAADTQLKTGAHGLEQPRPNIDKVDFDPVKQKGQGCVILLHGAPGVGKTSTAECVAAYTRRPLLPLTAGDIGFRSEEVESRLEEHFHLAQRWGCVLLLDEADVFLAKRTKEDLERNALVSVFLRVLEYYKGILILTTNRVGAFDEAFHSRIHLSLYYPALDRAKTLEVFRRNFRQLKKHNEGRIQRGDVPIETEKKSIQKYWKLNHKVLKWNGRQIRNAFQTATALAEYDARDSGNPPTVTVKHFEAIANASADFARYVTEVHGGEADQIALRDRNRLDRDPKNSIKLKKLRTRDPDSSESDSSSSENGSSSSGDSSNADDRKKRKKSKKKAASKKHRKDKTERKAKDDPASGKGSDRESKDSSSDDDD